MYGGWSCLDSPRGILFHISAAVAAAAGVAYTLVRYPGAHPSGSRPQMQGSNVDLTSNIVIDACKLAGQPTSNQLGGALETRSILSH